MAAQNIATAKTPDSYLAFGGAVTAFQADYGHRVLGGGTVFGDFNPTWRYGFESEARYLRVHTDEDVTGDGLFCGAAGDVQAGTAAAVMQSSWWGRGGLRFRFTTGPGRSLPMRRVQGWIGFSGDRMTWRVVDFEYQMWPAFASYGELRPFGLSMGLSWRVNPKEHLVKNADRWRWK